MTYISENESIMYIVSKLHTEEFYFINIRELYFSFLTFRDKRGIF